MPRSLENKADSPSSVEPDEAGRLLRRLSGLTEPEAKRLRTLVRGLALDGLRPITQTELDTLAARHVPREAAAPFGRLLKRFLHNPADASLQTFAENVVLLSPAPPPPTPPSSSRAGKARSAPARIEIAIERSRKPTASEKKPLFKKPVAASPLAAFCGTRSRGGVRISSRREGDRLRRSSVI